MNKNIKNKKISNKVFISGLFVLPFIASFLFIAPNNAAAYSGTGAGTLISPYEITTCSQLPSISNEPTAYYALTNNIDCSDIVNQSPIAGNFSGSFDGRAHIISGVSINKPNDNQVGLFSELTVSAIIKNVSIYATITGNSNVGIAAGTINNNAQITEVETHGSVTCDNNCGGIIGKMGNTTSLSRSWSSADVGGDGYTYGGLVGWVNGYGGTPVSISNVYYRGNIIVTGEESDNIGGIVGYANRLSLTNAYSAGYIEGARFVGGIIGSSITSFIDGTFTTMSLHGSVVGPIYGDQVGSSAPGVNYFDTNLTGLSSDVDPDSVPINTSNYFVQNSASPVFTNWDFENNWRIDYQGYPVLAPRYDPSMLCEQPSSTSTSITASCSITPAGWGIPTWEVRWQKAGDTSWTAATLSDIHIGSATINGLASDTTYNIQFRYTNDYGVSDWGNVEIITTSSVAVSTIVIPAEKIVTAKRAAVVTVGAPNTSLAEDYVLPFLIMPDTPTNTATAVVPNQVSEATNLEQPYVLWWIIALLGVVGITVIFALFRKKES